ncbi:MAG: MoxR family ATPase [SAR324 cluster bacterium]|uniref:AAA+ ATPase domain-containing protein n=1 Tax=marine metagenome TaxID=408172 RepID=A0A381NX82_9ZZZZ|nr:AAA family ATPase [Deltaproteobacteria bacterium]MCH2287343.1 MoxR family ATPase [SAR324 cluster bacterium]|tara:strand:+ start:1700 stop:2710 length:1011 start_codon:yes stop_codon:yes gene_type:complete
MSNLLHTFHQLQAGLNQVILGQERLIERLLIVLLADGHILVEGAPGLAKTRAIKALGEKIDGEFQRIQFTPDLLPADVTGTEIYRPQEGSFHFQAGPVFHNLVLADEINRAPAKVQSALLEAMGERQVTVGGKTYPLPDLFLVMATQNPIEQEGTYPLPEAQLDRFLLHVFIDYPSSENELRIMRLVRKEALNEIQSSTGKKTKNSNVSAEKSEAQTISAAYIYEARNEVLKTYMSPEIERYLVEIIAATRTPEKYSDDLARLITWGASPRGSLALDRCARARAWLYERDFVTPEDLQDLTGDVLRHRIIESYEAESDGITTDDVITKILAQVAVP